MTGEQASQPGLSQTPAIVLYGGSLPDMDDARRQKMAGHLAALLAMQAEVRLIDIAADTAGSVEEQVAQELSEPTFPFTIHVDLLHSVNARNRQDPIARFVEIAAARSPGVIDKPSLASSALRMLLHRSEEGQAAYNLFTYHYSSRVKFKTAFMQDLLGITFNNPQAIIDDPSILQGQVRKLGSLRCIALAQLITAVTRTRDIPENEISAIHWIPNKETTEGH